MFGMGHSIGMFIGWLAGIGLLVALVWLLAGAVRPYQRPAETPEEILKRRYAAGEIDTEEYERRLATLRKVG